MKRIMLLCLSSCLILSLHGMHPKIDPALVQEMKKMQKSFKEAVETLDRQSIGTAVAQIKKARNNFPLWQRWLGYSNISELDKREMDCLLSDDYLFTCFEQSISNLSWHERNSRQKELAEMRDEITRNLGYETYLNARDAYWGLIRATQECNPDKVTQAYGSIKNARELFSWLQKLGLTFFTEGSSRDYEYKRKIFSKAELAKAAFENLDYCTKVERCVEVIKAHEQEVALQPLAIYDSTRQDGLGGSYLRNPTVLAAFYTLKTPLNSAQLLEYAKRKNNQEMRNTIFKYNPELKI